MQMRQSYLSSGGSVRCRALFACLFAWILCVAGATAVAKDNQGPQACGDFPEPKDQAVVSSPAQMPSVYLARLIEGNAERVAELFAADGVHRGPDGQIRKGRVAIRKFYEGVLDEKPRKLAVGRSVTDSDSVAFELINLMEPCDKDDPAIAVDLMDINADGQIQKFTMFYRPRPD